MDALPTQLGDPAPGGQPVAGAGPDQDAKVARRAAIVFARWLPDAGLWGVACSGFALSYSSVQQAALSHVDHESLSYLLPVATDGGALAAAARYVADRRKGLAGARGWQMLAWAAIAASAVLNAMGRDWQDAVWHLVGPIALAVITELYAHRAAQLRKEEQGARESIPARLWLTSPRSSARLWLWTARTGEQSLVAARRAMDRYAAAREALDGACRSRADRRIRDLARDQLRSGVLAPAAVLQVLGWGTGQAPKDAVAALRALLATVPAGTGPDGGPQAPVQVRVLDQEPAPPTPRPVEPTRPGPLAVGAGAGPALPGPVDAGPADRLTGPADRPAGPVDRSVSGPTDRSAGPAVRLVADRSGGRPVDRSGGPVDRRAMPVVRSAGGPADQAPAGATHADRSTAQRPDQSVGADRTAALLPAAREIAAAHLAAHGRPIGRRPLVAALRKAGESCSTDIAAALLELLAAEARPEDNPTDKEEAASA